MSFFVHLKVYTVYDGHSSTIVAGIEAKSLARKGKQGRRQKDGCNVKRAGLPLINNNNLNGRAQLKLLTLGVRAVCQGPLM